MHPPSWPFLVMDVVTMRWQLALRPHVLQYKQVIVFGHDQSRMQVLAACAHVAADRMLCCISPERHLLICLYVRAAGQYQVMDSLCKRRRCSLGDV